jgi:hypothetical protein
MLGHLALAIKHLFVLVVNRGTKPLKFPSFHDCRLFLANSRWPKGTRIDIEATVVIPLKEATWSKMKVASSGANVGATSPMYWTRVSHESSCTVHRGQARPLPH